MITEILEEDFRKLNLKGFYYDKGDYKEVSLNDKLTENIEYLIENGYESNLKDLQYPVTIAIHINSDNKGLDSCYFDKFMNRYSSLSNFEIGIGIPHIYSTRDYYEMRGDYWRVPKKETKVLYRVHLDKSWLDKFVLKHKREISNVIEEGRHWIENMYDLENGEWVLKGIIEVIKNGNCTQYKPCEK